MTPLIKAEMEAGAIGWARGSQACIGISPAFVPKPMIAATAITAWTPDPSVERGRVADRSFVGEEQQRDPGSRAAEVRDRDVGEDRVAGPPRSRCRRG